MKVDPVCPECGDEMVSRENKAGIKFLGCCRFPKCRGTRDIDGKVGRVIHEHEREPGLPSELARENDRQRWRHQG